MNETLLTGATGFIGSHVLEALVAAGARTVVLARPEANLAFVRTLDPEVRYGDVRDLPSLCAALRGCRQVIHTAALVRDWGQRADFFATNVTGTLNVLEAARREGGSHVIITGSISSYGEEHHPEPKDETSPYASHYPYFLHRVFPSAFNWYRESKAAATEQAIAFARRVGLNLTVLEPPWVYGEREFATGFHAYVKAVRDGQRFMPGSHRNVFHVVYAGDLAKAYLLAWAKPPPGIERFIIGNPTAEPMHRIFALFCREAGLEPPRRLPKWVLYPLALAAEVGATLTRRREPPLLTRARVNMFYDSIRYSTAKAQRVLGFACDYTLEQGIRRTVAWYKENGYL